ncbi:MAG: TonB-dependent receptor [Bacteroidota bacterium]
MMLRTFVLGLLCAGICWQSSIAQDCDFSIDGRIFDGSSREALAFVSVELRGTDKATLSDSLGNFSFQQLCEKEYDLTISSPGYKSIVHHHDFHHPFIEISLAPDEAFDLESVVIEADRTSTNMESLSSQTISGLALEKISTGSLGEVASSIAGVTMVSTGQNIAKPVIHGLHSNRILLINNGLRHEFQNWGIDHAPEIDPSLIGRLQVVKGAATVRYGSDALGGVILVDPTPVELSTPLKGKFSLTGKSNGQSGEGTMELRQGFKWLGLYGGASYIKQGDLQTPDYLLTNTGKEETGYYGGFRLHPFAELDIEGFYSHFEQDLGILRGSVFGNLEDMQRALESDTPLYTDSFSYDFDKPHLTSAHDLYKAKASFVKENFSAVLQYGYQTNKRREFGVRRGDAPNIDLILKTESLDADIRHPDLGPITGKIGFQWMKQANDNLPGTGTVPFIPNYDSKRYGAYLIENVNWGKNTLELGLRYDNLEIDVVGREPDNTIYRDTLFYRNVSATLGYIHRFNKKHLFRTNVGTAWRPPNVAELYRFGQHSFVLEYGLWRYTVNEEFDFITTSEGILTDEERAVPSEVGYKWINTYEYNWKKVQFELTAYINYIENFIYTKPAGFTRTPRGYFMYFIYDQEDALLWGGDLTAFVQHDSLFSSTLKASYLWMHENFAEQPPPNIAYTFSFFPRIKGIDQNELSISFDYFFEQTRHPRILTIDEFLFAAQNGISRFAEDAPNFDIQAPPPAYLLTDVAWRSTFGNFELGLQVKNLFNVRYRSYTDRLRYFSNNLGRNFILNLKYTF